MRSCFPGTFPTAAVQSTPFLIYQTFIYVCLCASMYSFYVTVCDYVCVCKCVYEYVCLNTCMAQHAYGSQRTICQSLFSCSTMWDELKLLDTFTHSAISPAQQLLLILLISGNHSPLVYTSLGHNMALVSICRHGFQCDIFIPVISVCISLTLCLHCCLPTYSPLPSGHLSAPKCFPLLHILFLSQLTVFLILVPEYI